MDPKDWIEITWGERFYTQSYNDEQALDNPNLAPRKVKRSGPFYSYEDAMGDGLAQVEANTATHFGIDKVFTKVKK